MKAAREHSLAEEGWPGAMLLLPVALASLPLIGSRLHAFAREVAGERGEAKEVHDLRLAVQEACTNVIKHGRRSAAERRFVIRFEFAEDVLSVLVTDQGAPFEPPVISEPPGSREDPAEGGYGLFLMRALVDEMFYEVRARGNTLVLRKRLPPEEQA
jgi:anti-sigma regulatory factor (Ser/Thr protein kinase)